MTRLQAATEAVLAYLRPFYDEQTDDVEWEWLNEHAPKMAQAVLEAADSASREET